MNRVLRFFIFLIVVSVFIPGELIAQMTVTPLQTANQLVDRLVGPGVVYSNPTLTCPSYASGKFDYATATTVAMDSGIVLTTGDATEVNLSAFNSASTNNVFYTSDVDLASAATGSLNDLCKLEFDFVPIGDTIRFNYRFGSDEYPSYTCSNYNDIFSFFISGPGYAVPKNVALIPGTNCPVSINTVNGSTSNPCGNVGSPCAPPNNALFINSSSSASVVYSGLTQKLMAVAAVQPCSTYHMKFAIADIYDEILDSGVFLEANSFMSEAATVATISSSNNLPTTLPFAIEGCNNSVITIERPNPKPISQTISLVIGGTATSGLDYTAIPSVVTIPAFATTVQIPITALADALIEGTETVKVYVYGTICGGTITDSAIVEIREYPSYNVSNNDTICEGQSTVLTATSSPFNSNMTFTWTPTGTTTPATGSSVSASPLFTSTYTVTANYPGCPLRDSSITISVESLPNLNLTADSLTCFNAGDGAITATGNASSSPFTFTLTSSGQTQTGSPSAFTGLYAGNYGITITSAGGCTATSSIIVAEPMDLTITNVSIVDIPCGGVNSGQILVSSNGGTMPATYNLQPGNITNSTGQFTGLNIGNFTITVQDAHNCSISTIATIAQPVGPSITNVSVTDVDCFGNTSGAVVVTATSTSSINYVLTPGNITNTIGQFNGLSAGSYTVSLTDATNCTVTTSFAISEPNQLTWNTPNNSMVSCNGLDDGEIQVSATGGTGVITYLLQPGSVSNTSGIFPTLIAQTYTVTATDENNCFITTLISITEPSALQIINASSTVPTCVPGNDAILNVLVNGGTTPYDYSIGGPSQSTGIFNNLGAGNYTVTISDSHSCSITTVMAIINPNSPTFVSTNSSDVTCFNGSNGSVTVIANGGTGIISYTLLPIGTTNTSGSFSSLIAGTYTVQIADGIGCSVSTSLVINQPSDIAWTSSSVTDVDCNNANNGVITIAAAGGTGAISYLLNPGNLNSVTGNFTSLAPGSYTMTATDINTCTLTTTLNIIQPSPLSWNTSNAIMVSCNGLSDGELQVSALGGTGTITYILQPIGTSNTTGVFSSLNAASYTVTATDVNNCFITSILAITEPNILQINSLTNTTPTCVPGNDANINATAIGGSLPYSYSIGGAPQPTGNFINLSAGNYTITVTDDHTCSVTSLISIASPTTPIITSSSSADVACYNGNTGTISITANGGIGGLAYTLLPNGTSNTTGNFSTLIAGSYTVNVVDAIGCSVSTILQITQPADITWVSSAVTNVSCNNANNGTISISATGGTGVISYTLNPGNIISGAGNFSSLGVGTYTMTATDINSCTLTTTLNVIQPNSLSWNAPNVVIVSCNGLSDGEIQINANGGTGVLTYVLQPGNVSNTTGVFAALNATSYTVTATDVNNCFITTIVSISEPAVVQINSATNTTPTCVPGNDAIITVIASGGTLPFNYNIGGPSQASGSFSNLNAGSYTVTIVDDHACSATSVLTIVAPISPIISSSTSTDVNCFNGSDGSINVNANGGSGNLTYNIQPSGITNVSGVFTGLGAGNYTITATDAIGCSVSTIMVINQPTVLTWTNSAVTNVSCNNATNGTIDVTANGGTGAISYTLNPGNINSVNGSFNSLGVGTYTITATDMHSCSITTILNVIQPNSLSWNVSNLTMVSCNGFSDGEIQLSAAGGTGTLTYLLQPGNVSNTSGIFSTLPAFTYTITATDINNCFISTSISITEPPILQISSISTTVPTCIPGNDGSLTVSAVGGTAPYTYSIGSGNQSSAIFNGLSAGTFTITVTDDHSCTATSVVTIAPPSLPQIDQTFATEASCNPGCDAQVTVIASGGLVNTYTYSSNTILFQSSAVLTGLCAASYTIVVKDGNGCTTSSVLSIITAPSPNVNSQSSTNVLCNGGTNGSIAVTVSGGNGAINYTLQPTSTTNSSGSFSSLTAGNYSVIATDALGCTVSTSLSITQPPILQIDSLSSINVTCSGANNGSLYMNAMGGFGVINLTISPSATYVAPNSFTNLVGNTTYTVTATDANGCTLTTAVLITQPAGVTIVSTNHIDISCYGMQDGSIQVAANGGTGVLTYELQPGAISNTTGSYTGLAAGNYTVTVSDVNQCSTSTIVTIVNAIPITLNSIQFAPISCNNGSNGGLNISCGGGAGALNYQLQPLGTFNNTGIFTNLMAGNYTVVVTDANACTYTTAVVILNPSTIVFSSVSPTNINCYGESTGAILVQATGGIGALGYQLNPGLVNSSTGNFANLLANNYIITAIDANNCTASTSVLLTQPAQLSAQLISQQNPNCYGEQTGSIQFVGSGGTSPLSYNLQPGNISNNTGLFTNLTAGGYSLNLVDGNQCQITYPVVNLSQPNLLQLSVVQKQDIACYGQSTGSIQVAANGGTTNYSYSLVPSIGIQMVPGDFQNLKAGTYFITVTDAHACTTSIVVTLNQNPEINFTNVAIVEPVCYGDATGVISWVATGGTGNLIYQLDNNSTQATGLFTNLTGGMHTLSVIDGINCRKDTLVQLTEPGRIQANVTSSAVTCKDASDGKLSIQGIGGRGELTYYLRPGLHINKHGLFTYLHEGIYTLTVKDSAGCNFDTVMVVDPPQFPMTSNMVKQDLGCYGVGTEGWARVDVVGGVEPLTYLWSTSPTQVNQTATDLYYGYYFVDITDANGCAIHDTVYIEPGPCCTEIFIPNAFSPNGDGQNDIFKVTTSTGIELKKFEIYDRWGNKIWETFDPRRGWDGSYRGSTEDMNTFYYVFWYKCLEDGQTYMKKGDVIIVR